MWISNYLRSPEAGLNQMADYREHTTCESNDAGSDSSSSDEEPMDNTMDYEKPFTCFPNEEVLVTA